MSKTKPKPPSGSSIVRVAAYCRYSEGPGQDDGSIEAQHMAFERAALGRPSWRVMFFDEPKRSAFAEDTTKRPVFQQVMQEALAGRFDVVAVHKVDRWSRIANVTLKTWSELAQAGVAFETLVGNVDRMDAPGWLMAYLQAGLPEYYSRNLSEEVRKGQATRATVYGLHKARPPYGYRRAADPKKPAEPDEGGEWDGLRRLYSMLLAGATSIEAARAMTADGWRVTSPGKGKRTGEPRPFTNTLVSRIRHNVYYRPFAPGDPNGTILWDGEEYRGQHVAACTWDEWHAMRDAATGRRRGWQEAGRIRRAEPYTAEFRGLAACAGCGHRLHVVRAINPQYDTNYERYICKGDIVGVSCVHGHQWARVGEVRDLWTRWLVDHLAFPPEWERAIRDATLAAEHGEQTDELAAARERARWQRKRDAAKALYLEGEIERDEWKRRADEADHALSALAAAARPAEQRAARLVDAGRMALSVAEYWSVWTTQERAQAAQLLLEPCGLVVRPLGRRGLYHRYQREDERPPSCELVDVHLREPFRDLLTALADVASATA